MSQVPNIKIPEATGTFTSLKSGGSGERSTADGKPASVVGHPLPESSSDSKIDVEKIVEKLNVASASVGRDLRFLVNVKSHRTVIQVIDSDSGELIREIPAEKVSSYMQAGGNFAIRILDELA